MHDHIPTSEFQGNKTILEQAEWISKIEKNLQGLEEGPKAKIHIDLFRATLIKISNWKTPGHNGIQENIVLKNSLPSMTDWLSKWTDAYKKWIYPNGWPKERPPWSKKSSKKVPLINHRLFSEEQKGCNKGTRGIGELLYINQHILQDSKTRRKNLALALIDFKNAYDMVPQSEIIDVIVLKCTICPVKS